METDARPTMPLLNPTPSDASDCPAEDNCEQPHCCVDYAIEQGQATEPVSFLEDLLGAG
ncbi:MAG: hypothetical protein ACFB0C_06960 [Leptolyngbyaceae cyanobacterium]